VQFLVDAQLPRGLCDLLSVPPNSARHVKDALSRDATDADIWRYAMTEGSVIVTKDEDFARRLQSGAKGPQVVWVRLGNCSNAALRQALTPVWPMVCAKLAEGERIVEVV
jgi:predicted nuclease of predicted toxin-antitoxin system